MGDLWGSFKILSDLGDRGGSMGIFGSWGIFGALGGTWLVLGVYLVGTLGYFGVLGGSWGYPGITLGDLLVTFW